MGKQGTDITKLLITHMKGADDAEIERLVALVDQEKNTRRAHKALVKREAHGTRLIAANKGTPLYYAGDTYRLDSTVWVGRGKGRHLMVMLKKKRSDPLIMVWPDKVEFLHERITRELQGG